MVAFGEVGLYHEAEELLLSLHLEYGSVVVAEMVVSTLPQAVSGLVTTSIVSPLMT